MFVGRTNSFVVLQRNRQSVFSSVNSDHVCHFGAVIKTGAEDLNSRKLQNYGVAVL